MFYPNDVWYNGQATYWRGYKPYFVLKDEKLLLKNVPVPKPDNIQKTDNAKGYRKGSLLIFTKKWLSRHSYLYRFIIPRIKNIGWLYNVAIKLHLADSVKRENLIPIEFMFYKRQHSDAVSNAWAITEALLSVFKEETAAINSKFLIFYIPAAHTIYTKQWADIKKKYNISDLSHDANQIATELNIICNKYQIDFINPTALFKIKAGELEKQGKRLYYLKDLHWNVYGNEFAGEILANFIYSYYLTESRFTRQNKAVR